MSASRWLLPLLLGIGCHRAPPGPAPPRIVEVRVIDRSDDEGSSSGAVDRRALAAQAAQAIQRSSGLRVVDGGDRGEAGASYRLRVEVRGERIEDAGSGKGVLRALVRARLDPARPDGLGFDQSAVAERVYAIGQLGEPVAALRAHLERAVGDLVRAVGARLRLQSANTGALLAALRGHNEELRDEAIRVVGERRERAAVAPLLVLLKGPDSAARDHAIGALAAIGDPRAVRPLTEVARFRDLTELPKVLDALSAIGGPEARAYLEFVASGHESPELRELARKALGHLARRAAARQEAAPPAL